MDLKDWKGIADRTRIPSGNEAPPVLMQSRDGAGETSISLRTQPLIWQTKQISLRTKPFCPLTEPSILSEATDTLIGTAASGPQALVPYVFSSRTGTAARIRLAEKVHHGNMSIVWRAFDEVRQTHVAVKLVPRKLAPAFDAQTLEQLVRVSRHPGLVTLIEHGWQGQWWYQIAEWVDGKPLSSLCPSHPVSPAHAADLRVWMKQLAGALDAQHRAGFVHGDVKPSNVLVTNGQACLIDLVGLRTGASWTRHGGLTPAFASPEARKGAPADPRDDVYSLAAMISKLLTGEVVSPERASDGSAPPPAGITAAQWQALRGALHAKREGRAESAIQLVDAMWPVSAFPRRKPLPTPRRAAKVAYPPALTAQPRRPRRVHFGPQGYVGGKGTLTAALAAVVVIALGAKYMTQDIPAVAAISEPIAVPAPQWSRIERLEAQPMGVTPGLANSDVASTAVAGLRDTIPAVVLERAEVVATADPPQGRGPDRTASAVVRTPAAKELMATPTATSVAAATEVAGQRDTMPAAVREQAEVVATGDPLEERGPDRPDASAFADRAEVPLLPDRAQGTRTTADPSKSHPLAMPAVFSATESVFAARTDAAVTARLDVSAVSDRSVPDRPETSTLLGAVLDRPDQPERPDKPEHPEKPERPETIDKPDKPERPEVAERPEKPDRPEQIERPDKPERPEVVARPDVPERPDKPERPEQIERPDLPERPELVARPDIPERPDKPEKPDKPDKPDKPERPERPT